MFNHAISKHHYGLFSWVLLFYLDEASDEGFFYYYFVMASAIT